jgi:hypothetical protein
MHHPCADRKHRDEAGGEQAGAAALAAADPSRISSTRTLFGSIVKTRSNTPSAAARSSVVVSFPPRRVR